MNKALLFIIFMLMLFAVTPVIASPAMKSQFTAEISFVPGSISVGKVWITQGSIQHIMGAESAGLVTGDITGTAGMVSYETVNLNTGMGVNHGKFVLATDGGIFEGSFRSIVTPDVFSGTFLGQGAGMYEGQKIMGSYQGEVTIVDMLPVVEMILEGIIFSRNTRTNL